MVMPIIGIPLLCILLCLLQESYSYHSYDYALVGILLLGILSCLLQESYSYHSRDKAYYTNPTIMHLIFAYYRNTLIITPMI